MSAPHETTLALLNKMMQGAEMRHMALAMRNTYGLGPVERERLIHEYEQARTEMERLRAVVAAWRASRPIAG